MLPPDAPDKHWSYEASVTEREPPEFAHRHTGKNIVICSDGTGSTFDTNVSNVSRLIRLLALDNRRAQMVIYSQGIGTSVRQGPALAAYRDSIRESGALVTLESPRMWPFAPRWVVQLGGLVGGLGLKANVGETYRELSHHYDGPEDTIFLFGFSRGAFTVRALAGLLYRCGLATPESTNRAGFFEEAWQLYHSHWEDSSAIHEFREKYRQRDCGVHFLGLWDTVLSYGGLTQITLPHLRHNPGARIVRHALALDEGRSWFNATPWGLSDQDRMPADNFGYSTQDVKEVWFRGAHSDVGGSGTKVLGSVALRWIVGEAAAAGVLLNEDGQSMLRHLPTMTVVDSSSAATPSSGLWWLSDIIPRWETDHSTRPPSRKLVWGNTGRRKMLSRGQTVLIHHSVGDFPTKDDTN